MGNILKSVKKEIRIWPHVTAEPYRFGSLEFKYEKREMGYIHGNTVGSVWYLMSTFLHV
jgi:hypothetical protein